MRNRYDWDVGDLEEDEGAAVRSTHVRGWREALLFLLAAGAVAGLLVGGWRTGTQQLARSEKRLTEQVQTILDLEHQAFEEADGDLFFSVMPNDAAWRAAQLLPENQAASRQGLRVSRVQAHDNFVWANVEWEVDGRTWQRIAFFEWQGEHLVHAPSDPQYWGPEEKHEADWGTLIYHQVDEPWVSTAARFVSQEVIRICADGCLANKRPFILILAADYAESAAPNEIRLPSPRLMALDPSGQPAPLFWRQVRDRVESHLRPAEIRFAVPGPGLPEHLSLADYQEAAERFMAQHPDITVELVPLDDMPEDPAALATNYDGAAFVPSEAMLALGLVRDLTDLINSDPDFDQSDFYEQIWQGIFWQERAWYMPLAAEMPLIFYDRMAYRQASLSEPSLRWTWDEMAQDLGVLIDRQPASSYLRWGYLDASLDSLFSYAYNWNHQCNQSAAVLCENPLEPSNVAAALDWYQEMVSELGHMMPITAESPAERQFIKLNVLTTRRRVAIWVDEPVNFEHQLLLANLGVVPFPGSDRFDGISPLWVRGGFISEQSEQPLAVWEWLKFLSYQRSGSRLVPARPSVAADTSFWAILPRPLANAMRTAFPFARPVTIGERSTLTWGQVSSVIAGEKTPIEAAQQRIGPKWFQQVLSDPS